ncbi:MAG: hypothetical protein Kow0092_08880 [Deferrisomatales bacterium]
MGPPTPLPTAERDRRGAAVEAFARDLLALTRAVRVYPSGHPYLGGLAERLIAGARVLPDPVRLAVTPRELMLDDVAVGGPGRGPRSWRSACTGAG